jgi:hypothetical protein
MRLDDIMPYWENGQNRTHKYWGEHHDQETIIGVVELSRKQFGKTKYYPTFKLCVIPEVKTFETLASAKKHIEKLYNDYVNNHDKFSHFHKGK